MKIHWSDYKLDEFSDGCEIQFYGFGDWGVEWVEDNVDPNADIPADFPEQVYGVRESYIRLASATRVAEGMFENDIYSCGHSYGDASNILYWAVEELYSFCGSEPTDEEFWNHRGLDGLQNVLDRFYSYNWHLWRWLGKCDWYDPRKHSLGIGDLQRALNATTEANLHHVLLHEDREVVIELDQEFWNERIKDAA